MNLTVIDGSGHSASASALTITVRPALSVSDSVRDSVSDSASASIGNAPLAVNFTSAPSGGLASYSYAWTFGDRGSATSQNLAHTYPPEAPTAPT